MYDVNIKKLVTDIVDLPFQKTRRVCWKACKDNSQIQEGPSTLFGIEIPRNVKEMLELDKKNITQKWAEAIQKEMQGLHEHKAFQFLAPGQGAPRDLPFCTFMLNLHCESRFMKEGPSCDWWTSHGFK